MSIIDSILKAREDNLSDYKRRVARLYSDYQEESKTIKDYNGRQILELLQNADDEGSADVEICLDTVKNIFRVSNMGAPFSAKGFESLLLANNSSKTNKRKYIGNKGLGFRSILNWSEIVEIISSGCRVQFSKAIAKRIVQEELNDQLDAFTQKQRF